MSCGPPFTRTPHMDELCIEIAEMIGRITPNSNLSTSPTLHRALRIKTIYFSLVVEGNTLSLEQMTAILDGKRVLGDCNDIREVELLDFFAQNPTATIAEATERLGVSRATVDRTISSLRVQNRLIRKGDRRGGEWMVE